MRAADDRPADRPSGARLLDRAPLALLALSAFVLACVPLQGDDIWWHLRAGAEILRTGKVPRVDTWTYTDAGRPWIDLHWGFQVLCAVLHRIGGSAALIAAQGTCLAGAVVVAYLAGGRGLSSCVRAALWIPAVLCVLDRPWVRPEMLSLLFLAVWLFVAARCEARPRLLWLLPPLTIAWVNCHALFVLGFVVLAATGIDLLVRRFAGSDRSPCGPRPAPGVLPTFALSSLACGAATFVNPYFVDGALFPLVLQRKFTVDQAHYAYRVGEFLPLTDVLRTQLPDNPHVLGGVVACAAAVAGFAVLAVAGRRVRVGRLLLFAAFAWLAWKGWRNLVPFGLVAGFAACENFADVLRARRERRDADPNDVRDGTRAPRRWPVLVVSVGLAAWSVAVVGGWWARGIGQPYRVFGFGTADGSSVHDGARWLARPEFPDHVFVTSFGQAGVFLFHAPPAKRVFLDGRLEVASLETFLRHFEVLDRIEQGRPGWEELIRGPDGSLPALLFDNGARRKVLVQEMLKLPGWRLVHVTPTSAVFFDVATAERLGLEGSRDEGLGSRARGDEDEEVEEGGRVENAAGAREESPGVATPGLPNGDRASAPSSLLRFRSGPRP